MLVLRFTKTHTLNRIINYSTLKIFCVFNFCRNAISAKINYGENFQIYGTYIPTYVHTYIPTYVHTYIHTFVPTYVHTHIHTYSYVYVCMLVNWKRSLPHYVLLVQCTYTCYCTLILICCAASVAQLLQFAALALRAGGQGSQLHIVFSLLSADDSFIHTYMQ